MKRKLYFFLFVIILSILLLNGLLFHSAKLSAEYLQSKNVWGETEAIRLSDYRRQTLLLASLPKDTREAESLTQKFYDYLTNQKKLKDTVLPLWRQEELMTPPDDIKENLLFTQLQEMDLTNYQRLHELYYGINHYQDYVASVKENAASVISLLYPLGNNAVSYQNALQCQKDFADMEALVLVPTLDNGVNLVLHYRVTDFLALLMLILISLLFYYHLRRQALLMVESIGSFVWTLLGSYSVGLLALYFTNILITRQVTGLPSLWIPIQSLESFYSCPYRITLGTLWILWLLGKLATMLLLMALSLLAIMSKKRSIAIPLVSLFLVAEFFMSQSPVSSSSMDFLREINLFSGLTAERFFNRYLNVSIGSRIFSRPWLFFFAFSIPFVLCLILSIRKLQTFWEKEKADLQELYTEEIDKRYQETRRMWHDFNNHLLTIKALYCTGQTQEANDYIEKLSEENQKRFLPAKTGSNAVDLLLFQKAQLARDSGLQIRFVISCNLKNHGFRDFDLCSLLGNLLDNAIEASKSVQDETDGKDPQIKLRMEEKGSMLFLSCENEYRGERSQKEGQFLTTKRDSAGHGLGLLSVKQICNKYGGTMETTAQGQRFLVTILLNDSH